MAMTMTEDTGGTSLQKGLSEWWSEETEYVFQRIERWAAFARGYNRLRSQRLSRGRMTMNGGQEPRWSISSNKLTIDDGTFWSPRFHALKKSRRRSRPDETGNINCCGTFNYQSNNNLDSNCLETYRYDHSIYFKTIGDIKNSKRDIREKNEEQEEERVSISSEELVEWDVESVSEYIANEFFKYEIEVDNNVTSDNLEDPKNEVDRIHSSAWPIVDLAKLDLNVEGFIDDVADEQNNESDLNSLAMKKEDNNNNCIENRESTMEDVNLNNETLANCNSKDVSNKEEHNDQDGTKRFLSFSRTRRPSRTIKQPPIMGDDDVIWPSTLLNYTRNIETNTSPHRHHVLQN